VHRLVRRPARHAQPHAPEQRALFDAGARDNRPLEIPAPERGLVASDRCVGQVVGTDAYIAQREQQGLRSIDDGLVEASLGERLQGADRRGRAGRPDREARRAGP
jgi:hypothetical protein